MRGEQALQPHLEWRKVGLELRAQRGAERIGAELRLRRRSVPSLEERAEPGAVDRHPGEAEQRQHTLQVRGRAME